MSEFRYVIEVSPGAYMKAEGSYTNIVEHAKMWAGSGAPKQTNLWRWQCMWAKDKPHRPLPKVTKVLLKAEVISE